MRRNAWKTMIVVLLQLCAILTARAASGPPQITSHPASQSVSSGTGVTLSVSATGSQPLAYQWYKNSAIVSGATSSSLLLTNGSVLNAGDYYVSISNVFGIATSDIARVSVDIDLTFRLLALRTNGFVAFEVNTVVGDDRGGMAVSSNSVFLNGDNGTAHWRKSDLTSSSRTSQRFDALISDLRTEKAYTLANDAGVLTGSGPITALLELDDSGNVTSTRINFSTPITFTGSGSAGFFAGYGRAIVVDNNRAYNIDIPSGVTTDLGLVDISSHQFSENFTFNDACWGVAEYFDGELSLVYAQSSLAIVRTRIGANAISDVARFPNSSQGISDMASFTFSPSLSRWFFHYEGGGVFGSRDETLGWAKALFTTDPNLPQITSQPVDLTAYSGTDLALSVGVSRHAVNVVYQWRFNGADIPGATNAVLLLRNTQVADSGRYTVAVRNDSGEVLSAPALITILSSPPLVTSQPKDQVSPLGGGVVFNLLTQGRPPLAYQWRLNGTNLPGATGASLLITNIQQDQFGAYSVEITNIAGRVVSDDAQLRLISLLPENASFRVVSLGTSNARIVDDSSLVSSELGGMALTLNKVFYQGQAGTASFESQDLSNGIFINRYYNSLLSDLRTGTAYLLGKNSTPVDWNTGSATHLIELDPTGKPSGRRIALSSTIFLPSFTGNVGFFSGYGRVVVYNQTNFYSISLSSGAVADLGVGPAPQHLFSQSWAYWGIAENFGGTNYIVYARNNTTIARTRLPDGLTTTLATFSNIGQMSSISASIYLNRWYFHYLGTTAQFGGTSDTLGFADAVFEIKQADHYDFGTITVPQVINQPIPVTIMARDAANNTVTNYLGSVNLSGVAALGGSPIAISPTTASNFVNGVWTGQVVVAESSSGMFLRAVDSSGSAGTSGQFTVIPPNDLFVTASTSPQSGTVGQPLIYSLVVSNTGPGVAHNVMLTNPIPSGVVFQSVSSSVGSCGNDAGIVWCALQDIAAVPAVVNIQVITPSLGLITNQTFVSRSDLDANPADDSVTLVTAINLPSISADDVTVMEANTLTNTFPMNVRLNAPATNTVTVNYAMFNGTATANVDFVPKNGTLTFPPGSTNQVISLGIRNETLYETNEFFTVSFSNPVNATLAKNNATCTILNDDPTPTLSIGNASVIEGNSSTNARFEVRLSARTGLQIQVSYYTTNGTARAGSDYTSTSGVITFAANSLIQTQFISVAIIGDTVAESNEVFYVYLSGVSNALSGNLVGTGTIINDDGLGVLEHFAFSSISSPEVLGKPIPVTLVAKDFLGNTITNFNSSVTLSGSTLVGGGTNTILGGLTHANSSSGNYTLGYSFTPVHDLIVTHFLHYFGDKISVWTDTGILLVSQAVTADDGIWTEVPLDAPLALSAGVTYRIATYADGSQYFYNFTGSTNFADGKINASWDGFGDVFPTSGDDGVRWWLVDIRYQAYSPVAITPTNSGSFSSGVWSGNIAVLSPGANINLRAFDAAQHAGTSDTFDVTPFNIFGVFMLGGNVHVEAQALANRNYQLQASDSPVGAPWSDVGNTAASTVNGSVELTDPLGARPQRFYRVRLLP